MTFMNQLITTAEALELKSILTLIQVKRWHHWDDQLRLEAVIPGITSSLAAAYGVSVTDFKIMLANGQGMYITEEMKDILGELIDEYLI